MDVRPIDEAKFLELHDLLMPAAAEIWETIAWRTDLAAARAEAVQRHRPLFVWTMNGHPLGCT